MTVRQGCDRCDGPGGEDTYANQAVLPLNGRTVCVDRCVHGIVAALNTGTASTRTRASCRGHKVMPGRIDREDGRVLLIFDDPDDAERIIRQEMDSEWAASTLPTAQPV